MKNWGSMPLGSVILALAALATGIAQAASGPLQIRRISPSDEGVQPGQEVVIQFDRTMVALGDMTRAPSQAHVQVSPDPGCEWRWLNTSELACRLAGQTHFRPATEYAVTVDTSLKAHDGAHLDEAVTETFSTWLPQVDSADFQKWLGPQQPSYTLRFNMPVTAAAVAAKLVFKGPDDSVTAKVEPFTKKREGSILLPVPGAPGALLEIDDPKPNTPLDAHKPANEARRVWLITATHPLKPDTDYALTMQPGLTSPLGPLPGTGGDADTMHTYGDFTFHGIGCSPNITVAPGEKPRQRCIPHAISLLFSAPVPRATLAASIWQPAPPTHLRERWKNYPEWFLRNRNYSRDANSPDAYPLTFALNPVSGYRIEIPAGVKDVFGRTLVKTSSVDLLTAHRTPFLDMPPFPAVLEADEPTFVPFRFTNLNRFSFDYQRLFADDLQPGKLPNVVAPPVSLDLLMQAGAQAATDHDVPESSGLRDLLLTSIDRLKSAAIQLAPDRNVRESLGLRDLLGHRSGVVWGQFDWSPNGPYRPYHAFMQVTPYQVFTKLGFFNSLVWVTSFKTGQPVADAQIRLLTTNDADLDQLQPAIETTLRTDADGVAVLPGIEALGQSWFKPYTDRQYRGFYVSATHGQDMALLPLDGTFKRSLYEASNNTVWEDVRPPHGHMRTWLVTSQGIYRPGSEVKFSVFVRDQDNDSLIAPPKLDYSLTVTDPTGNVAMTRKHVKLSAFGDYQAQLPVSANAPTGWYDVSLSWPTVTGADTQSVGRFMVTEFVPSPFQVKAMLDGKQFGPGDKVQASASARLHAGGPYTDAKIRFTTQIMAQVFAPDTPLASGFRFGGAEVNVAESATVAQTDGQLNHAGDAKTQVALPAKTDITYGQLQVEAAVESVRSTRVAAHASAVYAARDRFVGVRTDSWLQTAHKPFKVQYLVVDVDGKPQAGSALTLQLQREVVSNTQVKDAAGEFNAEEQITWPTVDQCKVVSTKVPATCSLTPKHPGGYRVLASVSDTRGRIQKSALGTWVTGPGEVLWAQNKGVTLVPDKSFYEVGDVAHVMVQNPYPGARAMITVERFGMLWKHMVTLQGSAPVIDVPIGKHFFPGAYLSVAIFSGRASAPAYPDLGKPQIALGYLPLKIHGKGSELKITVTPDAPEHKPRETVHVEVNVSSHDGKAPGATRLVVAVVDQSVLDLLEKGAATYDPLATFYAPPTGPDVANFSLANQLLTRLQPRTGKGESPGGGGGVSSGPNVRSQFKAATYWNPTLVTDAQGKASFQFKLPDNLTRWRILVVAMTPGDAMGLGDASVRVNLPIQIEPALPNQVHVGDRFGAGFNVTNRTEVSRNIETQLEASGPIAGDKVEQTGKLQLAKFEHGLSWMDVNATGTGSIRFTGTARAGSLGDAMTTTIPVRLAGATEVAAEYGSLTSGDAKVPVKLPAGALPSTVKLAVNLSPTLIGGLDGAFVSLRDDPLQTWEIRLSRGVLASDYLRLKEVIGDSFKWPNANDDVVSMLSHASAFQAPSGGMAFWIPREEFVSPYLSVYTALAFNWLERDGHAPPADVRERLNGYLRTHILGGADDADIWLVLRAGALASLAPTGTLPKGAVAAMLPKLHKLDLFGQAMLLDAALDTHDHDSARQIAKSLFSYAEESGGEISFNEQVSDDYYSLLATPLRSNCAVLDALVEYKQEIGDQSLLGDTPAKLMRWVTHRRRNQGGWPNSQENVFCTTAIVHYSNVYETPVQKLSGSVSVAGKPVGAAQFSSRSNPAKTIDHALDEGELTHPFDVGVSHAGDGRLYYNVLLTYAMPPDALGATDAGMTVSRAYFVQRNNHWEPVKTDTQLQRGDIVRVNLTVDAPTERHFVVVSDPLPGAFEAVNRELATAMTSTPMAEPEVAILMFDGGAWPNMEIVTGGFYHRETALDAVRFYADTLPAGRYMLVYSAQVVGPGHFIAPAASAHEIYQPDVFGRGESQHIIVAPPEH
ncbi:MAG: alpha-2-macroglobulin family protein [Rudaea sp.]